MMAKTDEIRRAMGANIAESMGQGVPQAEAIPSESMGVAAVPVRFQGVARLKDFAMIAVDRIGPDPDQPREQFDPEALKLLAESLKTKGQIQPIKVRWDESRGQYVILVGERRWRAAQMAGLETVACQIHEGPLSGTELLCLQLVENCLREDLKPVEQARAYKKLIEANSWSTRQLATELALSQSAVVKALALLDLPGPVQERVEQGELPPSVAYQIARLDDPDTQAKLAERAVAEKLTGEDVEADVKARKVGAKVPVRTPKTEVRHDDGHKVIISGPAVEVGTDAIVEVLRRTIRKLQTEAKARRPDAA
jgi:ParB family transcriptional regulator, chromosome partitioning protein